MAHFLDICYDNSDKNRLTLYKSVIRAQLDYGVPVLNYNNKEIKRLEELQNTAMTRLLRINHQTHPSTINAINNIPTIRNRLQTLKLGFYMKLQQHKPNSLSHMVYNELANTTQRRPRHRNRLPPMVEARNIMIEQEMKAYEIQRNVTEYESAEQIIKQQIRKNQNELTINTHKKQCIKGTIPDEYRGHAPKKELPIRAIGELLQRYTRIPLNYEKSYIPQPPDEPKLQLIHYLVQGDNNPIWHKPEECKHCSECTSYHRLHNLLICPTFEEERSAIMDSIAIELDYYAKKFRTSINNIITDEIHSKLLDCILYGSSSHEDVHDMFSLLVGGKINPYLKMKYKIPVLRMLIAHTLILIQVCSHRGIPIPIDEETIHINDLEIFHNDLKQGKIVARIITEEGYISIRNIREYIESLEISQLEKYDIGLGSASTRTAKQKELAERYIHKLIEIAGDRIIFPDGSIKPGPNNKPSNEGGFGGVAYNKMKQGATHNFYEPIHTNDPQMAELYGIYASIQLANKLYADNPYQTITILCDCKNAVRYVTRQYTIPSKYSRIYQHINELLTDNHQHISIKWITGVTGHTSNPWNNEADRLAKLATTLHKQPPGSRSLDSNAIRNFRPSLTTD